MNSLTQSNHSPVSLHPLWQGVALPVAAWIAQELVAVWITSMACRDGAGDWGALSTGGVQLLLGATIAVALAISIGGGFLSWRRWKTKTEAEDRGEIDPSRDLFLAMVGVVASATLSIGILWSGLPLLMVNLCVVTR